MAAQMSFIARVATDRRLDYFERCVAIRILVHPSDSPVTTGELAQQFYVNPESVDRALRYARRIDYLRTALGALHV
jgi:hypothetical protein